MNNEANEALKNWQSLVPALGPFVREETKSAVRRKKMDVATKPNGTKIGVKDPGDTTVISIPYQPACANVSVGQSVWVEWLYDNFSTAIAVTPGNGMITVPYSYDSSGNMTLTIAGSNPVVIRGDGTASSAPLPVNQGGTGVSAVQSGTFTLASDVSTLDRVLYKWGKLVYVHIYADLGATISGRQVGVATIPSEYRPTVAYRGICGAATAQYYEAWIPSYFIISTDGVIFVYPQTQARRFNINAVYLLP